MSIRILCPTSLEMLGCSSFPKYSYSSQWLSVPFEERLEKSLLCVVTIMLLGPSSWRTGLSLGFRFQNWPGFGKNGQRVVLSVGRDCSQAPDHPSLISLHYTDSRVFLLAAHLFCPWRCHFPLNSFLTLQEGCIVTPLTFQFITIIVST